MRQPRTSPTPAPGKKPTTARATVMPAKQAMMRGRRPMRSHRYMAGNVPSMKKVPMSSSTRRA